MKQEDRDKAKAAIAAKKAKLEQLTKITYDFDPLAEQPTEEE